MDKQKNSILNKGISTPKGIFIIVLAAIIAGGGILVYQYWMPEEIEAPEKLNLEILKNTEYCCTYFLEPDKLIQLKDGEYSKTSYEGLIMHHIELTIYNNKVAFGDLNGDGKEDAAVILSSNFGGSGCFRELAIMINQDGKPHYLISERLGDRKIINSVIIQSGIITIDMITHGPNDPACCPTLKKIVRYQLSGDSIEKITEAENPVIVYFKDAELQLEGEVQKENVSTALNDILNLSEEQLKEKRYKDYTGKENQWDLPTLIYRHFVPDEPKNLGDNFYHDVKSEEVQNQIKEILEEYFK